MDKITESPESRAPGSAAAQWESNMQAAELKATAVVAQLCRALADLPALQGNRQIIETSPEVLRVTNEFWKARPSWVTGNIEMADALLLGQLIANYKPSRFVELGVASGLSSAYILTLLREYQVNARLESYDLGESCYFDTQRRVGDAVKDMNIPAGDSWKLVTGVTSKDIHLELIDGRTIVFIDASHVHPWPTIDFVLLQSQLLPGDLVVLHDINLPRVHQGKFLEYGAQILFDAWTGNSILLGDTVPNIAALVMDKDPRTLLATVSRSFQQPWHPTSQIDRSSVSAALQVLKTACKKPGA